MKSNRETHKIERTPEEQAEHDTIREQCRHPGPARDAFLESEKWGEAYPTGAVLAFLATLGKLKAERQRQGLTLAQVSERSGLDIAYLSRLENGKAMNPCLTTLWKYAAALGVILEFHVRTAEQVAAK